MKKKVLVKGAEKIFENINKFNEKYDTVLPQSAIECLSSFLNQPEFNGPNFFNPRKSFQSASVQFALTSLAAFRSEFNYIIADTQFVAKRITERAFIHLQRLIIVDEEIKKKWVDAFNTHETLCEKLGALHLLGHGVWAFKADATGGKTDLLLSEPLPATSLVESAAETLVLTEWKLVKSPDELQTRIQEAKKQAEIYGSDVLGGIELRNYRYLVMVSENRLEMPDDTLINETTYRHINIAVKPGYPSRESKRKKSK
ncbi:MAG: hypothetical protein C4575_06610 [Desulforudis sp.]|nr:MAG: hypothetical protein C4575_06610 [Desulforudis sp.]